ncbi:hypothetical protein HHK36_026445 [Tetracentron sinense]|uniref:RRM domain-containing protein n=1 Tax=Tetracentron sinense TaxID=13715 RepID=A0A834YGX2_TETSI|nr:hypothetical protein HHK36_026445 [Tetracentron sinense]
MKLRMRTPPSIFLLFYGGKRSISGALSVKSELPFSNGDKSDRRCQFNYLVNAFSVRRISHTRTLDKFRLQGDQSLMKRSLFSYTDAEDDFSELGLPVPQGGGGGGGGDGDFSELGLPVPQGRGALLKLVTEKPEAFRKGNPSRRVASGISLPEKGNPNMKVVPQNQSIFNGLNLDNRNGVSKNKDNTKIAPNFKNWSSITIEKVPSTISLFQIKEAVLVFGEISNAIMRTAGPSGFCSYDIEFQTVEAREKAVATGGIKVRSFHLPIHRLHVPKNTTIRISNISALTADHAIHSMCMSCGPLEGLVRTKEDSVDVFFGLNDCSASQGLLQKLNDVFMDDCRWSAELLPADTTKTAMTNSAEAQHKVGLQIRDRLGVLKKHIDMKKIYLEDLEDMHHTLMHLRAHPSTVQ